MSTDEAVKVPFLVILYTWFLVAATPTHSIYLWLWYQVSIDVMYITDQTNDISCASSTTGTTAPKDR